MDEFLNKKYLLTPLLTLPFLLSSNAHANDLLSKKINYQNKYQTMLNNLISKDIPGAVLLVKSKNHHFLGSSGYKDLDKKNPMTTDVVMPNGSSGKKLTALLIAMLADEGVINIDIPITKYLKKALYSQIEYSEKMTLRQLLNHTSGIFEYNDADNYAFFKEQFAHRNKVTTDMFPLKFALNQPAYFKPGEGHSYSNTGYALAGVILEQLLQQHPSKLIRTKILTPLNMASSYSKGVEEHKPELASGYFINDADPAFPLEMNVWIDTKKIIGTTATSDAPLASNVNDMAKLLRSIIKNNKVVNKNVREQIIGEKNLIKSWGQRFYRSSELYYGLGIWVEKVNGQKFYHHGGTEFGYFTQNIYIPDGDVSITAFANCGVNERCENDFQSFTFEVLDSFLNIKSSI